MIIIGIDPGLNGGIAIIGDIVEEGIAAEKFETMAQIQDILNEILEEKDPINIKAFVEDPPVFFKGAGGGLASQAKLHRNYGEYLGILKGLRIQFETVTPQKWQTGLPGLQKLTGKDRKAALYNLAKERFPHAKTTLKTCDAMLIAEYGKRVTL